MENANTKCNAEDKYKTQMSERKCSRQMENTIQNANAERKTQMGIANAERQNRYPVTGNR